MQHGNKKYEFEKLVNPGDTIQVKASNIYALKSSMRAFFGKPFSVKNYEFEEIGEANTLITRLK